MGLYYDFHFDTTDALIISVVFNFGCIFSLLLFKFLNLCQKSRQNKEEIKLKPTQQDTLQKQHVIVTTTFRITQQLLMLSMLILGCICLKETEILRFPFFYLNSHFSQILKLTFNVNIGRYFFLSFGNLIMTRDSKYPAVIIHHFVTLCTYIVISGYQQNMFLGICGLFMELSTTPVTISRILRDTNLHAKNMKRYYTLILAGCNLTLLFRGILPIICLTFACYTQKPFGMKGFPLVVFFMSVFFFGIINIWMIIQAFYTYSQTQAKKKSLSLRHLQNSPPLPPQQPSLYTVPKLGSLVDIILTTKTKKDLLKSTQKDGKIIVFENNLSSKAAQLSEKKVNISNSAKQNGHIATTQQNVHIVEEIPHRNTSVPSEHVVKFTESVNQ